MKQRAQFDYGRFAADFKARLAGRSYRAIADAFPYVTIKTLSRAANSQPLSPPNLLAVCAIFGLAPFDYFSVEKQAVTPVVSRETLPERKGVAAILDSLRRGA